MVAHTILLEISCHGSNVLQNLGNIFSRNQITKFKFIVYKYFDRTVLSKYSIELAYDQNLKKAHFSHARHRFYIYFAHFDDFKSLI